MKPMTTRGTFRPEFKAVNQAFERNFAEEGEIGASVCVFRNGEMVVDLWGGHTDAARTRSWERDTLVNVWSTTKGIMALCVARATDQGLLDFNRPIADYWPEFAAGGKGAVTVAQLFSHQAGLCGPLHQMTEAEILDTESFANLLAQMEPLWPVGSRSGYHALTIGPLADELFKRVCGKTLGQYFRDEIAVPLGVDFHMGLPLEDECRVAETAHDGNPSPYSANFTDLQKLAQVHTPVHPAIANLRAWREQGTPSAAGQGNARSLATLYSALATDRRLKGVELLSEDALKSATSVQIENEDLVLLWPIRWGIGFVLNGDSGLFGPNPGSFGHYGWGGSFAFADPNEGIAVSYAMNYMRETDGGLDPRFAALVGAVYASITES